MDRFNAALEGRRLLRGLASKGMSTFDYRLLVDGQLDADGNKMPDFEIYSTDGPTREYLQRRVTFRAWPWTDLGSGFQPRMDMPITREVIAPWDKPNPLDDVEFTRGKREIEPNRPGEHSNIYGRPLTGSGSSPNLISFLHLPHEVCYLDRRAGRFNSWEKFGARHFSEPPKPKPSNQTPHWHNSLPFAVDYLRRSPRRRWIKPTCRVHNWYVIKGDRRDETEVQLRQSQCEAANGINRRGQDRVSQTARVSGAVRTRKLVGKT